MIRALDRLTCRFNVCEFLRLGKLLCVAALLFPHSLWASDQTPVVFRLGEFDGSSAEFQSGVPDHPVRVAADDPAAAHHWYAFQPELSRSGNDGKRIAAAPRVISFRIADSPASHYTVRLALLIEHPGVPVLQVSMNGQSADGQTGNFFLDPKLNQTDNDESPFFPSFSHADVSFDIPGSYLHAGENTISFAAVAETNDPQGPDAGFHYDAISMEAAPASPRATVRVLPTVFFRDNDGTLQEGLDVIVRPAGTPISNAGVTINGTQTKLALNPADAWGEHKERVYVPAFEQPARAAIELTVAGRTERQNQTLLPQKRWTLYIVPHIHLDIGYTDYQAKVAALQSRAIDESLDMFTEHPDFRFSLDGMWNLEQFLDTRRPDDIARAIGAMKAGQLFVPPQYCNLLTGIASGEVLIRSLYAGAAFQEKHGLPTDYVNITDVPSFTWSYASVLAAAGIPQLLAGSNNGRGPVLPHGHLNQSSPFWWEGPDGGRVLTWYSYHYHQMLTTFGLPPLMHVGEETLPIFLQQYEGSSYRSSSTIMYGTQVENSDLFPEQASFAGEWNSHYAYPHLQYSGFHEALSAIAADFKNDIPVIRGDGGPYWEDGVAADAYFTAMERETEARGPSAEKLATISTLVNSRIAVDKAAFDDMWKNMLLMDEHTWLAAHSYTNSDNDQATVQLRVKDSRAIEASGLADSLLRHSMADLADSIDTPANSLVVFNTLNWSRSGSVSVDIRKGQEIVDATTGKGVPASLIDRGENTWRASFWANDVPAVGYRTYRLRDAAQTAPHSTPTNTLENEYYRVEFDPLSGAVRDIYDKSLNRNLVDTANSYRFGQYLYVTTDARAQGARQYVVHPAREGRLVSIDRNADGITAHLRSSDVNTPSIETSITLPTHGKTILITEELDKTATTNDEAVYVAFPFAMPHPQFEYEIQNGTVDPARDMYPGAGLDWFSIQHWAAVQQDGIAAAVLPLDAPMMTFGDITRVTFPSTFGTRQGSIFSYAMNNYWRTNYRAAQGGHFRFRYVITSAPSLDAVALSRLGWEESTPLEVTEVTTSDRSVEWKRPLDGRFGSFLQLDDPALVLEAWKPAEDGRGTILRILDLGGTARTACLRLPMTTVEHAWVDDALEHDKSELTRNSDGHSVEFAVKPHAILTVRLITSAAKPVCGPYCKPPT